VGDHTVRGFDARRFADVREFLDVAAAIDFNPPTIPRPMPVARTTMPRTIPK
jgi:hypothetical protein